MSKRRDKNYIDVENEERKLIMSKEVRKRYGVDNEGTE